VKEIVMDQMSALALAIAVSLVVSTAVTVVMTEPLAASLFGSFAALLVVGYQIARARPVAR
jgi:hypothetical protein